MISSTNNLGFIFLAYILVQGDNKQVSEEIEAFRKLASNLKASPPNQPGAVDER